MPCKGVIHLGHPIKKSHFLTLARVLSAYDPKVTPLLLGLSRLSFFPKVWHHSWVVPNGFQGKDCWDNQSRSKRLFPLYSIFCETSQENVSFSFSLSPS